MANELSLFQQSDLVIPDYLKDFMAEEPNVKERGGVPSLTYKGRKWTTVVEGEAKVMERRNVDGDMEPVGVIRVIILDYAQKRGRTYYEGDYDPDKPGRPTCWSADSILPDSSIDEPRNSKCDGCPMSVKGSKINALNKPVSACQSHRMVAVLPAGNLKHVPLRLRLAVTSDFDGQSPDLEKEGWFAFRGYLDYLRQRGVTRTAAVVTKMKFDPNVDYPKVVFSPDKLITDIGTLAQIKEIIASGTVNPLINETWTPNGVDGTPKAEEPAPAQRNVKTERAADASEKEPFITPEMEDDSAAAAAAEAAAKKAAAAAKTAATKAANAAKAKADAEAAAKKAAAAEEGDSGFGGDEPAEKTEKATATASNSDLPDDVAALLNDWGS